MQTLMLAALPAVALTLAALDQSAAPEVVKDLDISAFAPVVEEVASAKELGVRHSGLQAGSLTTHSLDSGARGLTPEDEWREIFPKRIAVR